MNERALLDNHLAFTGYHRGEVRRTPDAILIESASPDFVFALPEHAGMDEAILDRYPNVRLLPWSGDWASRLTARGYVSKGALRYMTWPTGASAPVASAGLDISVVGSARQMAIFSEVQTRSFLTPDASYSEWFSFLDAANQKNVGCSQQSFFLGALEGRVVGVTLLLVTGAVAGIYAVATLPEFRKRGVSSTLLGRALAVARDRGCECVSLQVMEGSAAHALYDKLGFQTVFRSPLFSR
ncbi:MAG: GNAT family N-acetyltransferase [Myxococcaceae bacterium]